MTDSNYQAMFLTTRDGVVLIDAMPTLGHNLQRAVDETAAANGRPRKPTGSDRTVMFVPTAPLGTTQLPESMQVSATSRHLDMQVTPVVATDSIP